MIYMFVFLQQIFLAFLHVDEIMAYKNFSKFDVKHYS